MNNSRSQADIEGYYDLVRLYAAELLTTTNWMMGRKGALRRVLQHELRLADQVVVITFNHDLLAENALALVPERRYGKVFCLEHAYGFDGRLDSCANTSPVYDLDCPGDVDRHVQILKLHGSVNWVFRTRAEYPPADLMRKTRKLLMWNNIEIPPWSNRLQAKGRNWYLWPLVVPPIYEKHGFIHGELRQVWNAAGEALRQADRIVFWGYSFPRADLHARYFFQGASLDNQAIRRPIHINPDPQSESELWDVLRPERVTHYHDVTHFLSQEAAKQG